MGKRLFLSLFCLSYLIAQQSHPPSPTPAKARQNDKGEATRKQSGRATNNGDTESISTAIDKLTAEIESWKKQADSSPEKSAAPVERWQKASTIISAVAAFFIFILAVVQAVVIHKQRLAMDKQSDLMDRALAETTKAANAAKSSAESLMSSERAWLKMVDILEPEANIPNGFWYNICNQGKTPARITALICKCESRPITEELPNTPDYSDAGRHIFGGEVGHEPLLVPAEKLTSTIRVSFPEGTEWPDIYTEATRMYAYGFVTYIDSFEREHTLRFGYMYLPFRPEKRRSQWAAIPLREYNQQN